MAVSKAKKKPATKVKKLVSKISRVKKTARKYTKRKKVLKPKVLVDKPIPNLDKVVFLERHERNPIIEPREVNSWESKATFNPTALYKNEMVHVIYRAVGSDDVSRLGYARSNDGLNFYHDLKDLCYFAPGHDIPDYDLDKLEYSSGGGGMGGCEDPRITEIDGKVYMLYTAFDGWGSIRIALTHISLEDFLANKWNWSKPVYISKPGEINKNWVLFPEKVNGMYAIIHSVSPKIQVEYLDSLDVLDGSYFIESNPDVVRALSSVTGDEKAKRKWDNKMRGVGPSPIKTKYGWLLLYHAMDFRDYNRYKIGAMILDLENPEKVLYRSSYPVLEPDAHYENEGYKRGVIYSCGAIVKNKDLYIYYGGADMVSCVATANLDTFIKKIISGNKAKLITKRKKKKK
jgi:predicted GH43/DUF377 family glycosyl hydrolase